MLVRAVEHKIITKDLSLSLDEYLAFRHFFVHGYGIHLQEALLQPLEENIPKVWHRFELQIESFITKLRNL